MNTEEVCTKLLMFLFWEDNISGAQITLIILEGQVLSCVKKSRLQ